MARKITCIKKVKGDHENAYTAIESMNWTDGTTWQFCVCARR